MPLTSTQLTRFPRNKLPHSGILIFATVTQGTYPDLLVWKITGIITAAPKDCKYLTFKKDAA